MSISRQQRRKMERDEQKKKTATYNLTRAQLEDMVTKEATEMIQKAREDAIKESFTQSMIVALSLSCHVLMTDYWHKSFVEKCPNFCEKVLKLYNDFENDLITLDEIKEELWELGGVKFVESEVEDVS